MRQANRVVGWSLELVVFVVVAAACSKASDGSDTEGAAGSPPAASPKTVAAAPSPAPPEPPAPSPLDLLMTKTTLADAIDHLRGEMTDTNDETSNGALMLALWAAKHLEWSDVAVAKNETSAALVRKDSDASRGKRMCVKGEIIQIEKNKLDDGAVFSGLLIVGYSEIFSFIAAGSTGALVQRSRAKLCGVVIGTYDYSNSGGGKGHAVSLVGMFDLPENRVPSR